MSVPLSAIRQPAFLYDTAARLVEANDLAEGLAGRPLAGTPAPEFLRIFGHRHPDGTPFGTAELPACRALAGGEVVNLPFSVTTADGGTLRVLATASPIREDGTVTGALVVWQDITDLVATGEALAESDKRVRLALRNAPTAVFHQDRDLRYTWYGNPHPPFAETDLIGKTDADLMAPEGAAPITALKAEVLATGEARRGEVSVTAGGATTYYDLAVEPVRDADGQTVGVMGVSHDITEWKRAEKALAESEARQAFLLHLSDDIRPLADAGAIQAAASRALGEHLGADRVLYGELAPAGERITVEHGYAEGVETWTCSMQTMEFGTGFLDALRAGRTILVSDTAGDDRVPAQARAAFAAAEVRSLAAVPLAKGARLGAVLLVQQSRPRQWTPAEVALVEETAERTWAAVERARAEEALRESEERFRRAIEDAPIPIIMHAEDGQVLQLSRTWTELTGYPPEEVPTFETWLTRAYGEGAHEVRDHVQSLFRGDRRTIGIEFPVRTRDGEQRYWSFSASSPGTLADGRRFVVGMAVDITGKREVEAERERLLAEAGRERARLQTILDSLPVGVWVTDAAGAMLAVNEIAAEIYGGEAPVVDRVDGYDVYRVWHPGTGARVRPEEMPLARALAGTTVMEEVLDFERFDGTRGTQLASAVPIRDAGGAVTGSVAIVQDITRLRLAEEALRKSEARQAFLLKLNDSLAPLADPAEIQETAARVLGERLGADRVAYFEVDDGEYVVKHDYAPSVPHIAGRHPIASFGPRLLAGYRAGTTVIAVDIEADPDLSPSEKASFAAIQVRAQIAVPLVKAGAFVAGLAVHMATPRDWTPEEVALVEETAERTWAALERARAEAALREQAESLRRSNEDLERFAYVASHDLQEPLRSIVSFSQLLERRYRGQLGEDADEYIEFIVEGGTRMQGLILDLLAFSRVNTTRQQIARTDVEDVFAEAVRALDVSLREAGATLTHDPLPVVMADPTQLAQVFANLVSNAVKFRKPDVPLQIHVGVRHADGFCEFSVSDNGIGIAPEYFEKIFVIFQRLHTKETYPGTGIGLAIVKRIIDRHGGKIWVESTPGEGSTFFFTLPAA